jgi:hypothetical protein
LEKVQVEASLDLAQDGRGNDSAYPSAVYRQDLYTWHVYILTSLGMFGRPGNIIWLTRNGKFSEVYRVVKRVASIRPLRRIASIHYGPARAL